MKLLAAVVLVGGLAALCTGCAGLAMAPVMPPPGLLFSDYKAPLDIGVEGTTASLTSGEATAESYLGLITVGDASRTAAMKNGQLRTCKYADYKMRNILGIYAKFTTVVYGEK